MSDTIEAEVVPPPNAVVLRDAQSVAPAGLFGTSDPAAVIQKATIVATALKQVIQSQGLISKISGKEYPKCEAWTLLGTMLGVFPVLEWTRKLENGWEARVQAKTKDGSIVGAAEAECLRSEKNWANRDDFALRSMAQTRATAKCLRMPLGFVMTLSGFEPTPAEEMTFENAPRSVGSPPHTKTPPPNDSRATQEAPKANSKAPDTSHLCATEDTRKRFIARFDDANRQLALNYAIELAWLMPNEPLESLELRYVPVTMGEYNAFTAGMVSFFEGKGCPKPYEPHIEPEAPKAAKPVEVPRDANCDPNSPDAPWRSFPMPWGKEAGTPLAKLDKKYLFGLWANFEVETEYNGKPKKPETIAKDQLFRVMLTEAGAHYDFQKP